jgi:hypothetical protein
LEDRSIRTLYKNRLCDKIKPLCHDIVDDWKNIKDAISQAAFESLGCKSNKKYKWLRAWNEDIKSLVKKTATL